ncbi:Clp1/GlmU family protein [Hyperthermus butylicus]
MVLGAIFGAGAEFSIHSYRSYGVKALDDSIVEVELGAGAAVESPQPGEEVLDAWVSAVDSTLRRGCKRVMVLGPTDAGKSSLTALVVNRALLYGFRVGVVDADVGQADVGPPASVSAALVDKPILWLRELRADHIRFIGNITPQRSERRIVAAVVELVHRLLSRGAEVIAIDTDGWVQGLNSIEYKAEIARYTGVSAVFVIGDQKLYAMVRHVFAGIPCGVTLLPMPSVRRERDRVERRSLRREAYRRYLEPLYERMIYIDSVSIMGSCFFSGERLPPQQAARLAQILQVPVIAASETYDTVYVVTNGQPNPQNLEKASQTLQKQVYILDINLAVNALASLVGSDGEEKGLAIVKEIDFASGVIRVLTPYRGEVKGLILGNIRLSEELEETGRPLRCVI